MDHPGYLLDEDPDKSAEMTWTTQNLNVSVDASADADHRDTNIVSSSITKPYVCLSS